MSKTFLKMCFGLLAAAGLVGGNSIGTAAPTSWGTNLTLLNGSNPNGPWSLYVQDDAALNTGIITGWFVTLTTANAVGYAADNAVYATPTNLPVAVGTHWNVTVAATNSGPSFSASVRVTDTLPAGLTLVSSTPSLGTVVNNGSTLVWSLGDLSTNAGGTLTLSFTNINSAGIYTNTATVSSDTSDPNPDDDTAVATATVSVPSPPTLAATLLPHGGGFQLTISGDGSFITTLQGSTNLLGNWVNLASGYPTFIFTDTNINPARFYRALVGP